MSPITHAQVEALQNLRATLQIVTQSSPNYDQAIARAWPADERQAGAVVFPSNVDDVVAIVQFVKSEHISIAVKSGGHGHFGSSTEGGLCIDMSLLNQVSVDVSHKRVEVGGGAMWNHVHTAVEKEGLAVVGGETSNVGVAGLALHGGYGWLTGAHGLALDNIIELEVVLQNGVVVRVSEHQNQDLFWAMRGAGGSFGIVTKFILRAFQQNSRVWFGFMNLGLLNDENVAAVVEVSNRVLGEGNQDGIAAVLWSVQPSVPTEDEKQEDHDGKAKVNVLVAPFFNGSEEDAIKFFEPLVSLKPAFNTCRMAPFSETTTPARALSHEARKMGSGSAVLYPFDFDNIREKLQSFQNFLNHAPDSRAHGSFIGFEVHNPQTVMMKGATRTAYPARGNHAITRMDLAWTDKANDELCKSWLKLYQQRWVQDFQRRREKSYSLDSVTKASTGLYPNYDGKLADRF
jgi:FAD/FMN-containing dehydrogenase